jgi:hypothetical protein
MKKLFVSLFLFSTTAAESDILQNLPTPSLSEYKIFTAMDLCEKEKQDGILCRYYTDQNQRRYTNNLGLLKKNIVWLGIGNVIMLFRTMTNTHTLFCPVVGYLFPWCFLGAGLALNIQHVFNSFCDVSLMNGFNRHFLFLKLEETQKAKENGMDEEDLQKEFGFTLEVIRTL